MEKLRQAKLLSNGTRLTQKNLVTYCMTGTNCIKSELKLCVTHNDYCKNSSTDSLVSGQHRPTYKFTHTHTTSLRNVLLQTQTPYSYRDTDGVIKSNEMRWTETQGH